MSSQTAAFVRIPSLKTVDAFRRHLETLSVSLPCDDVVVAGDDSPLRQPAPVRVAGRAVGNRWAIHPMEGWDATSDGRPTEAVVRRWRRFGESGAKLIWGGEAMAVRPDGRANPNQLILSPANRDEIAGLKRVLVEAHREAFGRVDDLMVGFQLTHSGRFCRPNDKKRLEPRIAYRHPLLDRRFQIDSDGPVLSDAEVAELVRCFVRAARVAHEAGADFVDIKHCHGYLLHEFLGAHTRPGPYGGSFENRTRILREIVEGIRADGNPVEIGVRLSAFDMVPFRPDPARSAPGKPGPGIPEDFSGCLPYRFGFGMNPDNPVEPDLSETIRFAGLCASLGVRLLNLSAGSPYYNPHLLRPAAYPPSDGYQPAYDPLVDVARQLNAVREIRAQAPRELLIVGSGYTYLQEYLPHVAQAAVRSGWTDVVGMGRMVLSYPRILADATTGVPMAARTICRTFSDCTTAPRNGLPSGCYPLDPHYVAHPAAAELKAIKRGGVSPKPA